jgi:hypothetical protein
MVRRLVRTHHDLRRPVVFGDVNKWDEHREVKVGKRYIKGVVFEQAVDVAVPLRSEPIERWYSGKGK